MLMEHAGKRPTIDPTAWVAPDATLCGNVTIGPGVSRKSLSACASRVRVSLKKVLVLFDNSFLFHFFLLPFGPRNRRNAGSDISLVFLFFLLPFELSFQKCSWI